MARTKERGQVGGPAAVIQATVSALIEALKGIDNEVDNRAHEALDRFIATTWAALPALFDALDSDDTLLALSFARALGTMAVAVQDVVPRLVEAIHGRDHAFGSKAAVLLGLIGAIAGAAGLLEILQAVDDDNGNGAAEAMDQWATARRQAIPALMEALKSDDANLKAAAVYALGFIGVPAINQRDPGPLSRLEAPRGRGVIEALEGNNAEAPNRVPSALGMLGPGVEAGVQELIRGLEESLDQELSPDVRLKKRIFIQLLTQLKGGNSVAEAPRLIHNKIEIDRITAETRELVSRKPPQDNASSHEEVNPSPSDSPESEEAAETQALIQSVFAGLAEDAKQRLEQVAAKIDALRQAGASISLEPLRTFLTTQSPETLEKKKALAAFLSNFLERLGVAICYRQRPCALFVAASEDYPRGRFLIVPHGSSKALFSRIQFSDVLSELQPLELVEMVPPMEEPPKEWRDRMNRGARGASRQ